VIILYSGFEKNQAESVKKNVFVAKDFLLEPAGHPKTGKSVPPKKDSFLSVVFLFPGYQDTCKQEEKHTEDTARKGCRPKELGGNTGVDQIEVDQDQHRRKPDDGQNDRDDIKRYYEIHDGSSFTVAEEGEHGTYSFVRHKTTISPFLSFSSTCFKRFLFLLAGKRINTIHLLRRHT
jgi:hypothetical protein